MQQLVALLDLVDRDVSGIQFMLGYRTGSDHVGRVWLDVDAPQEALHR